MNQNKTLNSKAIKTVVVAIVVLIVLPGSYYFTGNFILPASIKSGYLGKNCGLVLGLNSFYTAIYPSIMADKSLAGPVNECAIYSLATDNEQKKAWQDAYNAYKTYSETYSKGLFVKEAHEHSAAVLTAWSKELLTQKNYEQAIGNLDLVLKNYGDTTAATEAADLMPQAYTAWGTDLRDSSDFSGSENTLKAFEAWAQNAKKTEGAKSAQHELAQTYLAWELALQSQKQFDDAKTKLDLAISTDPEHLANSGPADAAKAAQAKLYVQWGDYLVKQKDFAGAIERYKTVITFVESKDQPAAKDTIANGYLRWAASLSDSEDFLGALKQVDEAGKNTGTDAAKKSVESAKTDTYIAFSKSGGSQAQKAMKDAARGVCENNKKPDLPIFGIDKDKIQAALYGVGDKLPENVAAQTPGAMHYVVCIQETILTLESHHTIIWRCQRVACHPIEDRTFFRHQYLWHAVLVEIKTNNIVNQKSFIGTIPERWPPISKVSRDSFSSIDGHRPSVVDLANWILTAMK